jgi:hypothetical protein
LLERIVHEKEKKRAHKLARGNEGFFRNGILVSVTFKSR